MNYLECIDAMDNLSKSGMNLGLDTIKTLLDRLDNPQKGLKYVHVAGTNGKGSVCAFLTKILTVAGYKVGTYNSPAVFQYNEHFSINGRPIDNDKVAKYLNIVLEEREIMEKEIDKWKRKIDKERRERIKIEKSIRIIKYLRNISRKRI